MKEVQISDLVGVVMAYAAEFEAEVRSRRIKSGLARAVADGKVLGRPKGSKSKK